MALLINGEALAALVLSDHQPREAVADDGSQHMLYWDAPHVRSVLLAEWPQKQTEFAAQAQLQAQAQADALALRLKVMGIAQGAVGVAVDQLTLAQTRALVALLLWKEGALTPAGAVRPLAEWVR